MARRLPPLNALRVFEAAARVESFSAAADELCVTHGAVSRQVAQLEAWLGLKLFERRGRRVVLTVSGREVPVQPVNLSTEKNLLYRAWVEHNREYVAKTSLRLRGTDRLPCCWCSYLLPDEWGKVRHRDSARERSL